MNSWPDAVESRLHSLTSSTIQNYRTALDEFHRWYIDAYGREPDPELLTDDEVQAWRHHLSAVRGLASRTIARYLAALNGVRRPLYRPQPRQRSLDASKPLAADEVHRLFEAIADHISPYARLRWLALRDLAMVAVLACAGLQTSEIVGLDLTDVEITDQSRWIRAHGTEFLSRRRVPLSQAICKVLSAYLAARPSSGDEALFISKSGKRMAPPNVQEIVRTTAQQAGIEGRVTPRTLRYTFADQFLENGGDEETLRALLGHTDTPVVVATDVLPCAGLEKVVEALSRDLQALRQAEPEPKAERLRAEGYAPLAEVAAASGYSAGHLGALAKQRQGRAEMVGRCHWWLHTESVNVYARSRHPSGKDRRGPKRRRKWKMHNGQQVDFR